MNEVNNTPWKNVTYLLMADVIWGTAYVAQQTGGKLLGSYTFNCIRFLLGALVLLPVILLKDKFSEEKPKTDRRLLLKGGIICGLALSAASNFQQLGISMGSSVGKAGFLTSCYIVMVPIAGIPLGKKCSKGAALGVILALWGMYLLCMTGADMTICLSDILLLICAVAFVLQILAIDHFAPMLDTVKMSFVEFLVCGLSSAVLMVFFEMGLSKESLVTWAAPLSLPPVWLSIAYAGICSSGIAYSLQIAGQRNFNPTVASLLMSLESVFSLVAGWILLHERMSMTEMLGCLLIFMAVITAQLPEKRKKL